MDPHRLAEARSIALHGVVAERLRSDPQVLASALRRVESWLRDGSVAGVYARRWKQLLSLPTESLCAVLVEQSEEAAAMRQVTPFAGVVESRLRWKIWRQVRAASEVGR